MLDVNCDLGMAYDVAGMWGDLDFPCPATLVAVGDTEGTESKGCCIIGCVVSIGC